MKYYTCDVCGDPMTPAYERSIESPAFDTAAVCKVEDICPACKKIGESIQPSEVVLREWRRRVSVVKAHCPDDTPKYAGNGGREKMAIYERLATYRGTPPKLGVLASVSALTGGKVSADELRGILNGNISLPIDKWRLIGKAMDELEGGADG